MRHDPFAPKVPVKPTETVAAKTVRETKKPARPKRKAKTKVATLTVTLPAPVIPHRVPKFALLSKPISVPAALPEPVTSVSVASAEASWRDRLKRRASLLQLKTT